MPKKGNCNDRAFKGDPSKKPGKKSTNLQRLNFVSM